MRKEKSKGVSRLLISISLYILVLLPWIITSCEDDVPKLELVTISGVITDEMSNEPISGASISWEDEDISAQLSGADGVFRFSELKIDDATYRLTVTHADFENTGLEVTIEEGKQSDSLKIMMMPAESLDFGGVSLLDFGSGKTEIKVTMANISSVSRQVSISFDDEWASADDDAFTIASGKDETITFAIDRSALEVGQYESELTFEVAGGLDQSLGIRLQKLDAASAILEVDQPNIDFGKATESSALVISNTGQSDLQWTATKSEDWISLSASSGSIDAGGNVQSITISVDRDGLETGSYEGSIDFTGNGGTATVGIVMEVDHSVGLLSVSTTSIDFAKENVSQEIVVSNEGTESLEWTASADQSWISLDETAGSLSPGDDINVNISIDRAPLDKGIYTGSVSFIANEEATVVFISMEVEGGVLQASISNLNFGNAENNLFVTLSNIGARSLNWNASENESWLTLNPSNGTIDAGQETVISVTVDRTGLSLGDYQGTISISGDGGDIAISTQLLVEVDTDMDGVPDNVDADVNGNGLIEIYTIDDLDDVRNDLTADGGSKQGAPAGGFTGYELMNDLNFSSDSDYDDLSLKATVTSNSGWQPLGTSSEPLGTTFEGNGFTISNLFINRTTEYIALIRSTNNLALIQNLNVEIRYLSGGNYTAGLLALNTRGTVTNCHVSGSISGNYYTGLLIGRDDEGTVEQCSSQGAVSGYVRVGGLIGDYGSGSSDVSNLSYSHSTASVSGNASIGGLVGGRNNGSINISNCYATGDVSSEDDHVGGLMGYFVGTLTSSYSTGSVTSSSNEVGGLIGQTYGSSTITSCFSTGRVTANGTSRIGGLVGYNWGGNTSITDTNYWDVQTSGLATTSGGGTGLTTSELQAPTDASGIYITWSASDWDFGTSSQYPALKGMPGGLNEQR